MTHSERKEVVVGYLTRWKDFWVEKEEVFSEIGVRLDESMLRSLDPEVVIAQSDDGKEVMFMGYNYVQEPDTYTNEEKNFGFPFDFVPKPDLRSMKRSGMPTLFSSNQIVFGSKEG